MTTDPAAPAPRLLPVLAVDPGLKRIGLAASDRAGVTARALEIFVRGSLEEDIRRIAEAARREAVALVLIGTTHEKNTRPTPANRYAHRLLAALRAALPVPVQLQDEALSTVIAQAVRVERGDRKLTRRNPDDALAAAAMLQEYLDARTPQE